MHFPQTGLYLIKRHHKWHKSGYSAAWSSAFDWGSKGREFESLYPDHFFALMGKKNEAVRLRFMHRRCASYILMLDEQSSQAQNVLHTFVCLTRQRRARHKVLHKSLTMKHCSASAPQYEAASFHSAMKHSLRSYDEKMKNESFRLQYIPCSVILTVERKTLMEKSLSGNQNNFDCIC